MAKITVKELKDDALVSVQVNKSFYFMVKSVLFYLFKVSDNPDNKKEEVLKGLMNKDYKDMTHWEQSFYTLTLLLAEIERQAVENNQFADVEVDVPDDQTKN
jgi:trehalose/maltose hydrolase-like predicted phosphorylase